MIDKRVNYRFGSEGYQGGATNQGGAGKGTGVSTGGARGQAMGMGGKQRGGTFSETGGKTTGGSGGPDRTAVSPFSKFGKNVFAQRLNPNLRFDPRTGTMKNRFSPSRIFGGVLSLLAGIPGVGLVLGGLKGLRGFNPDGSPRTQEEYELAMQQQSLQNRLDNLYDRKSRGLSFSQKNIDMLEAMGVTPSTAQNVLTGRDLKGFTDSRTGITSPEVIERLGRPIGPRSVNIPSAGIETIDVGLDDPIFDNALMATLATNSPALAQYRSLQKKQVLSNMGGPEFTTEDQQKLDQLQRMEADPVNVYSQTV